MAAYKFLELDAQYSMIKTSLEERFKKLLKHKQFINGPEVQELEEKLKEYIGVSFVLATNSGTSSLILALMAAGIKPGDEVITSPLSFGATAQAIMLTGSVPVFVDIEKDTGLIQAHKIEEAISKKTRVLLPVSLYGQVCDMDVMNKIAEKHGLFVIEDSCQSFGASYKGKKSGSLASAGAVSFFPAKPLGAYGNAGCVLTNSEEIGLKLKKMRHQGQSERFFHEVLGFNALMNSFQAAVLLSKLEVFEEELKVRREKAHRYDNFFKEMEPEVSLLKVRKERVSSRSYYVLKSKKRDQILKTFEKEGCPLVVHYPFPLFDQPVVKPRCRVLCNSHTVRQFTSEIFSLPLHAYLSDDEQERIVQLLKKSLC